MRNSTPIRLMEEPARNIRAPWFHLPCGFDHPGITHAAGFIEQPLLSRFSAVGMASLSTRRRGRRRKSAKARIRGKFGTGGERVLWGFNGGARARGLVTYRRRSALCPNALGNKSP